MCRPAHTETFDHLKPLGGGPGTYAWLLSCILFKPWSEAPTTACRRTSSHAFLFFFLISHISTVGLLFPTLAPYISLFTWHLKPASYSRNLMMPHHPFSSASACWWQIKLQPLLASVPSEGIFCFFFLPVMLL